MTELETMQFWRRFDDTLRGMGETLTSFAAQTGIKYKTLSMQRTRHSLPSVEQLASMATYTGKTMESLLTGNEDKVCQEAKAVQTDSELQALVRAIMRDRRLLAVISAIVESYESEAGIG